MEAFSTREMAERLNVSPRLVRRLASQGRIYPAKRTRGGWLFYANSTVIRPPERAGRKPQKMRLPHEHLTINQFVQHSRYWLKNS
jgi:excisionase family DNA binding protein